MKKLVSLLLLASSASAVVAAPNVGVSVNIVQPGVYGRIDIGSFGPPQVIHPQPVLIARAVTREPVYLYVPPGHQKHWGKHCGRYNACGQPVYFVQERWVRDRWEHKRDAPGRDYKEHKYEEHKYKEHKNGGKHGHKSHGRRDEHRGHGR